MPRSAAIPVPEALRAAALARPGLALALFVAALTAWRLACLWLSRTDLFVDEAQYWFWSTDLAFGYFSKPPLVAWAIRAATELGGDATPFWVRAPAPLLLGAAALLVGGAATRLYGPVVGALSGAAFATLPGVSFAATVIATDAVTLPFVAGALWLWLRLADRPTDRDAVLFGLCIGVGALGKYAMFYMVFGAFLAALAQPRWRLPRRQAALAAAACLAALAPNLIWNAANGFATLAHTAHNASGAALDLNPGRLAEFLGAQFGVMGPILFAAFLAAAVRPGRGAALLWFSAPILALVSLQALRAGANANWAAPAFVAATPLAVAWLAARAPRWLAVSFALHLAVALALPATSAFPGALAAPDGRPLHFRVMGQDALAREIGDAARAEGLGMILSGNRALTAAMLHAMRDTDLDIRALRPAGPPAHHFELAIPAPARPEADALLAALDPPDGPPEGFVAIEPLRRWTPDAPFLKGRELTLWRLRAPS